MTSNSESSGRFHTDWLNMMYPRLKMARNLLRDDGAIVISIDSGEFSNLIAAMNEIFGEENAVVFAAWHKRVSPANDAKWFSTDHDIVVIYAKNKDVWRPERLERNALQMSYYKNPDNDSRGVWNSATYTCNKSKSERPNLFFPITNPNTGEEVWPSETAVWKYSKSVTEEYIRDKRIYWGADGRSTSPRIKLFLSEMGGVVPRSIWPCDEFGHTQEATAELQELFGGKQVFDSPKPLKLLGKITEICCSGDDDLVLDFFAGSGTTGHAIYERNSFASCNHRFILIQMPEPIEGGAFTTIADITKERLRRASARIAKEKREKNDFGFRVFKLDSSNIETWDPNRDDLEGSIDAYVDHVKDDRSDDDVLYELLLKLGLDLCVPIEQRGIAGKSVHSIGAGVLYACLDQSIDGDDAEALAHGIVDWHKELAPAGDSTIVFRDSAFADDVVKTNLTAILHQHGLENVRSL